MGADVVVRMRAVVRNLKRAMKVYGAREFAALETARRIGATLTEMSPAVPEAWREALRAVMRELLTKGGPVRACSFCACREDSACELIDGEGCSWIAEDEDVCSNARCVTDWRKEKRRGR